VQILPGMNSLRLALAAAVIPLLSACTAVVPLDLTREVTLQSPGGAFSAAQDVDLATVPAVWSRRGDIDAVSIDEISATVRSLGQGHQAASVSMAIAFRPEGAPADGSQDLQAGTLSDLPFVEGASVTLRGSAALDAFLLEVLHGSGRFTAIASGSLAGPANAVIEVSLKGSAAYQLIGT
jgi:hypothetical protein